jgi:UDP-N-acetylmuramoyl-L-alanyl-D-glutamate--2,6-diaminopimelate ligase
MRPLTPHSISLAKVADLVCARFAKDLVDPGNIEITGVSLSDATVESGDLFIAAPGASQHGARFIESAHKNGAIAIITDEEGAKLSLLLPTLIVRDPRVAGALISSALFKEPMRDLFTIGITGTNGKTTVSTLLYQLLQGAGRDTGLIGTVETRIGLDSFTSARTTPEATDLQSIAATMRERHMRHLVMEVSSHALTLKRVKGSHFNIVGFTNLTQDHLDFHETMENYFLAKSSLFTYEYSDLAFINIDDVYGQRLAEQCEIPSITVARSNPQSQWHYVSCEQGTHGASLSMRGTGGILIETTTSLRGGYNYDNLLMAIAIASEAGVDPIDIAALVPSLTGAIGRFEPVSVGQNFGAFVDYAHTPDAVHSVLKTAREFTTGKVIAVLGCGGDRDSSKRPLMGKALLQGSDVAIFTSDNPRSEKPESIVQDMVGGAEIVRPSQVLLDRLEAIEYAVSLAQPGDSILVLGKGHETGQEINGKVMPFDDRLVLAQAIESKP